MRSVSVSTIQRVAGEAVPCSDVSPDRVYVRLEPGARMPLLLWGMEHAGLRSEVVETLDPARRSAGCWVTTSSGIESDLRRGVGLAPRS
jgi:hypothetical protein